MKHFLIIFTVGIFLGCASTNKTTNSKSTVNYKFQAGIHHGGIVENTDLEVIPGIEPDAFSGATRVGISLGAKSEIVVGKSMLENGLDVLTSKHIFDYNDELNANVGKREISVTQIRVPLSYNFTLFNNEIRKNWFQLKLGLSAGYTHLNVEDKNDNLPAYSKKPWSIGPMVGLEVLPFTMANGSNLGLHMELHRSGQVYKDFYNVGDMPGLSYFKFGLTYRLPN